MSESINDDVYNMLAVMLTALETVADAQQRLEEKLDAQALSLSAIAHAIGLTFHATGTADGLPQVVLEDPAFTDFLINYPLDGPPIVGEAKMDELVAKLDRENPASLARGFRDLERMTNLSQFERIRNRQVERAARQKYGDLESLERGKDR